MNPHDRQSQYQEQPQAIPTESDAPQYVQTHAPDVRTLLAWVGPNRPFRKRHKEYYINILIILLAVEVILFLFSQYMLMILALAVVFLAFALATVPPQPFHYKISTQGITVEDHYFLWQELYDFYFRRQDNVDLLILRTKAYFPGELVIPLTDVHREHIKQILLPYLPFREFVKPSLFDRSADWLAKTFPLEKAPARSQQQPQ
jgi:hypothetical protein